MILSLIESRLESGPKFCAMLSWERTYKTDSVAIADRVAIAGR